MESKSEIFLPCLPVLAGHLVVESSCQEHSLWPCVVASRREISVHQLSIDHYLHHS